MLVSRALVVYTLVPPLGRLPGSDPIDRRYQTVMYSGGLRGIAMAIALSLPDSVPAKLLFVTLAVGAVVFTLVVHGLTIEGVVRHSGLHVPPLSDRMARLEGMVAAKRRTLEEIPQLQAGGLFSPRVADEMRTRCGAEVVELQARLAALRGRELDDAEERRLLHLRCFGEESALYHEMCSRGRLSESAYRSPTHSVELQTEGLRHLGRLPDFTLHPPPGDRREDIVFRALERLGLMGGPVERLRAARAARDYEVAWARFRGSGRVLEDLRALNPEGTTRGEPLHDVSELYAYWHESARSRLDQTAELFPEFVTATQERLADRLALHAQRGVVEDRAHAGIIPHGVGRACWTRWPGT